MKIVEVKKEFEGDVIYYVKTERTLYDRYRRDEDGNWQCYEGVCWEDIDLTKELEEHFQTFRQPSEETKCTWTQETESFDDVVWETSCGKSFIFIDGTPKENQVVFCCYCGKEIDEVGKKVATE